MSDKIFDVFDEYSYLCKKITFTLAGDRDWTWLKIYIFSKEDADLVEESNKLDSLLVNHNMHEYGEFSVCLDHLLLPDTAFAFLSKKEKREIFNFLVNFWKTVDENGSMTWTISDNHISYINTVLF